MRSSDVLDTDNSRPLDMTVKAHLVELKRRLITCAVIWIVGCGIGFSFHKEIEHILSKPLNQTLYYSSPGGGLSFVMQIVIWVGFLFALPCVMYNAVQYLRPAVREVKTRTTVLFIIISLLLSVLAIVYSYVISLPAALAFLTTFNSDQVKALISVGDYTKFLFAYLLGSIITFQIPLILIFTNKIRRFPPGGLTKTQRPMILGAVVAAGIITPTVDPVNQLMIALPIILLYEIGVLVVWRTNRQYYRRLARRAARHDKLIAVKE